MGKAKPHKTNAVRLLEQKKIIYQLREFDVGDKHLGALAVAQLVQVPPERIYKTLVTVGKNTGPVVAVIPADAELDLKKLAKVSGNKKIEMLPMKDLEQTTGYVRGGCSPVGMKKQFPTYFDQSAEDQATIFVSAGKRGLQLEVAPTDLVRAVSGKYADVIVSE